MTIFIVLQRKFTDYYLLSFGAESSVFQLAIQILKINIQNFNFAICFVWMWKLVAHIEGGTSVEGVWE